MKCNLKKERRMNNNFNPRRKYAFHTSSDMDNSDDDEEEMAMLSRKFKTFLKQGKFKKNKDTNDNPICFKCNKAGHINKDCPLMKSKGNFKNFNKFNKKKPSKQLGMTTSHLPLMKKKPLKLPIFVSWLKKMRYKTMPNY